MWKPSYVTAEELADWIGVVEDDDPNLALATEAASRAIDQACNRQFGATDAAEAHPFKAYYWRGTTYIDVDDTFDVDLTVAGMDSFTLYPLRPWGKPYTQIQIPRHVGDTVEVIAVWGWPEVPDAIKQACLIQAARFWERRDSTGGPLVEKNVDDVRYKWGAAAELDADVASSIAPYRRLWAAV